ncbi:hypothetical protein HDV02_001983 [Globomyces sp. JEL0801]|nr:hypothetical protein HDV02_001983 [Globomyces sp. JEL0801]
MTQAQRDAYMQLRTLFPDAEIEWLKDCVRHYKSDNHLIIVQEITQKLTEWQFGYYPKQFPSHSDISIKLNNALLLLLERFPDVDLAFIRDLILKQKSNIEYNVTNELLKMAEYPKRQVLEPLKESDMFRDNAYIIGSKSLLMNEFPYHWESSIQALMAESNNYYTETSMKLESSKLDSFWKKYLPFTKRKKSNLNEVEMNHPSLRLELQERERIKFEQSLINDLKIAHTFNTKQYEDLDQCITCECCFGDYTFEELRSCQDGHMFCKSCIYQSLKIGMYDTGLIRGKELYCMSSDMPKCTCTIPEQFIKDCVPDDLFKNYQMTIASKSLEDAVFLGLPIATNPSESVYSYILAGLFIKAVATTITEHYEMDLKRILSIIKLPVWLQLPKPLLFNCKNQQCLKVSCVSCSQLWSPLHKCFEKEKDSLRVHVELAMSQALIRTCPSCHIRFSKIDGCNKMSCPYCKYVMCYICRQDIRSEGYSHFCEHFRIVAGSACNQCTKCDLYQKEADAEVVRKAAIKAEQEWKQLNPESTLILNKTK